MTVYDIIGIIGVTFVLVAYGFLQAEKINSKGWRFSALNAMGAVLIMVSLYYSFNLASFIIECAWLTISLYGLFKAWRLSRVG